MENVRELVVLFDISAVAMSLAVLSSEFATPHSHFIIHHRNHVTRAIECLSGRTVQICSLMNTIEMYIEMCRLISR